MTRPNLDHRASEQRAQHDGTGLPSVHSVYQPIVDLRTNEVVAYEALARGPRGHALESPDALFARARELGVEADLDLECQAIALRGALQNALPSSIPLFVNAEPRWLHKPWPAHLRATLERGRRTAADRHRDHRTPSAGGPGRPAARGHSDPRGRLGPGPG